MAQSKLAIALLIRFLFIACFAYSVGVVGFFPTLLFTLGMYSAYLIVKYVFVPVIVVSSIVGLLFVAVSLIVSSI